MFPAVVVDFAADAPAAAEQRVLEACNAAIAAGRCERPGASGEPPRSRARVRTGSELEVRIELERFGEEGLDPVVRVLEFSPSDPDGERWRSVGLALATLVGEVVEEVARAVRSASVASTESTCGTAATVATAPLATSASGAEPTPPQATAPAASSIDAVVPRLPAEPENDEVSRAAAGPSPLDHGGIFVGVGVLSGAGTRGAPLRWGGGARVAWVAESGLRLSASIDYSRLSTESLRLDVGWLRAAASFGYVLWHSGSWALSANAGLGVRHLGIDARTDDGAVGSDSRWSPAVGTSLELGWLERSWGGAWLGIDVSSVLRETYLIGPTQRPDVTLSPIDASATLGFWWQAG
jgi:hypothetical protein